MGSYAGVAGGLSFLDGLSGIGKMVELLVLG